MMKLRLSVWLLLRPLGNVHKEAGYHLRDSRREAYAPIQTLSGEIQYLSFEDLLVLVRKRGALRLTFLVTFLQTSVDFHELLNQSLVLLHALLAIVRQALQLSVEFFDLLFVFCVRLMLQTVMCMLGEWYTLMYLRGSDEVTSNLSPLACFGRYHVLVESPRNPEATKKRSGELAQKVDHQRGGLEELIARANEALKRSREIVKRSKRRKLWT